MINQEQEMLLARRQFFTSTASGLGAAAIASLLTKDGLLAAQADTILANPLAPKKPHFEPTAKNCIFVLPAGAPSHLDLFDPKPKLRELHGQPLPESQTKNVRFAFIKKETAVLAGSAGRHWHCQCSEGETLWEAFRGVPNRNRRAIHESHRQLQTSTKIFSARKPMASEDS